MGGHGTAVQFALDPAGREDALSLPRTPETSSQEGNGGPLSIEMRKPGGRQGVQVAEARHNNECPTRDRPPAGPHQGPVGQGSEHGTLR